MSYPTIPSDKKQSPSVSELEEFLADIGRRKEFYSLVTPEINHERLIEISRKLGIQMGGEGCSGGRAYIPCNPENPMLPALTGMQIHGAQLFVQGFMNPSTPYSRLLLNWQTGTGKSIAVINIARFFIDQYRKAGDLSPSDRPTVFVIGFTRAIIQTEMLRRPELGFVSYGEVAEIYKLRELAQRSGSHKSTESRNLNGFIGMLKRRFTDRSRGGYFQFYGYKEFASRLFLTTTKGKDKGFDPLCLFAQDGYDEATPKKSGGVSDFVRKIAEAETSGYVRINPEIMHQMRGGLIVADEIHNVYNIQERNNYGIALQYVLDAYKPADTPRAIFMSATPVTGSVTEYVDLINLLVPRAALPNGRPMQREDLFLGGWKPGALDELTRLTVGRVSFLLDGRSQSYPVRRFVGEEMFYEGQALPYLRFIACPMSPLHSRTLKALFSEQEEAQGYARPRISANAHSIYDMVFPNPGCSTSRLSAEHGLYNSTDTLHKLAAAPAEWKEENGIVIAERGRAPTLSGDFLSLNPADGIKGLPVYSSKYARMCGDTIDLIKKGPGKILIYNTRVHMSGVLMIQEILQMNGIISENSPILATTLCAVCGGARKGHKTDQTPHAFRPARYSTIHGEMDSGSKERAMRQFNALSNLYGYEIRVLIGSRVITEGLNFTAVRHELITSLPSDIPTLIQVFGRVVRKDSHAQLAADQRDVEIRLYVSTASEGDPDKFSPELARYSYKLQEYLLIQEGDRALRQGAIDSLINSRTLTDTKSILEGLPLRPLVSADNAIPVTGHAETFTAYGYGDQEVETIAVSIRALFIARPVWTYEELWEAVKTPGLITGVVRNASLFSEDNFALALEGLCCLTFDTDQSFRSQASQKLIPKKSTMLWDGPRQMVCVPDIAHNTTFYILVPLAAEGAIIDFEAYLRGFAPPGGVRLQIHDYIQESRKERNFRVRFVRYEKQFGSLKDPIELLLTEYDADFHYTLMENIVTGLCDNEPEMVRQAGLPESPIARTLDLYKRFRVLILYKDILGHPEVRKIMGAEMGGDTIVGYSAKDAICIYANKTWHLISHNALEYGTRYNENDIIIGYTELRGAHLRFKVRPPLHQLEQENVPDSRSVTRGAVCETRSREELEKIATALGLGVRRANELSSLSLCRAISSHLLDLEEKSRNSKNGMKSGKRWFYLFNEKIPIISLRSEELFSQPLLDEED